MVGTQHKFVTDSGWALAVPKTCKHPEVVWDIVRSWALDPAAMRAWAGITGALPALKVNGTPEAVASIPAFARAQPLFELGVFRGFVPAEAVDAANGAVLSNFFAAVRGTKTVPEALKAMEETANAVVAQYK
jgi:ABC-type glycerol-3-phosphate transport system substrate-binding protein